nr:MAG TPA: hypothetical protein [Caudoviricetes sp.]
MQSLQEGCKYRTFEYLQDRLKIRKKIIIDTSR